MFKQCFVLQPCCPYPPKTRNQWRGSILTNRTNTVKTHHVKSGDNINRMQTEQTRSIKSHDTTQFLSCLLHSDTMTSLDEVASRFLDCTSESTTPRAWAIFPPTARTSVLHVQPIDLRLISLEENISAMSNSQPNGTQLDATEATYHEQYKGLQIGSYTDQKLVGEIGDSTPLINVPD